MIDLDTTVAELGKAVLRKGPRLGIELEYENFDADTLFRGDYHFPAWSLDRDPSLRDGGIELISRILQPGAVAGALLQAEQMVEVSGAEAHDRCGVHIHVNMSDFTMRSLWSFLTAYVLVEPSLFKQFADGRQDNHFCVPLYCNAVFAQYMYDDIRSLRKGIPGELTKNKRAAMEMLLGGRRNPGLSTIFDGIKYSALNLKPLSTLGTAEFRLFPGTTDMMDVRDWARFVLKLRALAVKSNDPLDIMEEYENLGLDALRERLGLDNVDVDPLDQEEAEDVATMAAGHIAKKWQELEWEIN